MADRPRLGEIGEGFVESAGSPNWGTVDVFENRQNQSYGGGSIPREGLVAGDRILEELGVQPEFRNSAWTAIAESYGPTWYTAGLNPESEAFQLLVDDIRKRLGF